MKQVTVRNMLSEKTGKAIPNQFVIYTDDATYFQSYDSIIAKRTSEYLMLDSRYYNYSNTTSKYRNKFTGLTTAETKKAIKEGKIILANLN